MLEPIELDTHYKNNWKEYWKNYPGMYMLMFYDTEKPLPIICKNADIVHYQVASKFGVQNTAHFFCRQIPGRISGLLKIISEKVKKPVNS